MKNLVKDLELASVHLADACNTADELHRDALADCLEHMHTAVENMLDDLVSEGAEVF